MWVSAIRMWNQATELTKNSLESKRVRGNTVTWVASVDWLWWNWPPCVSIHADTHTNTHTHREVGKFWSGEADSNHRPKDYRHVYSPPLYQLSYRRTIQPSQLCYHHPCDLSSCQFTTQHHSSQSAHIHLVIQSQSITHPHPHPHPHPTHKYSLRSIRTNPIATSTTTIYASSILIHTINTDTHTHGSKWFCATRECGTTLSRHWINFK